MNYKNSKISVALGLLVIALALVLTAPASGAKLYYLTAGKPDGVALLAPPPAPDSAEQAADLDLVRAVFKHRTPDQEARAVREANPSCFVFSPVIGTNFRRGKFPKLEDLLKKTASDVSVTVKISKAFWHRERPFNVDKQLFFRTPSSDFCYPSGHSARGTAYALILADVFPAKKEIILATGRDIGWERVVIAKHYLSDVRAGRVLAQAIVRELMKSGAFQHDLAEAKAEVQAATAVGPK